MFSLHVGTGGRQLNLTVEWPKQLVDPSLLHRKWLLSIGPGANQEYHPKYMGFDT